MAERSKAAVLKIARPRKGSRGFESHSLRWRPTPGPIGKIWRGEDPRAMGNLTRASFQLCGLFGLDSEERSARYCDTQSVLPRVNLHFLG